MNQALFSKPADNPHNVQPSGGWYYLANQQPIEPVKREWRKPDIGQIAVLFCLVIVSAAIAGAVPHAPGFAHKCLLVALDLTAWGYVVVSLVAGGGK